MPSPFTSMKSRKVIIRGYKQQFRAKEAKQIEGLISRIEAMRYPTGPSRYYGVDLAMCLASGALAGSLIVASALMEIYIRGLVIRYSEIAQNGWARRVDTELELEGMREETFYRLLEHLVHTRLFFDEDAEKAKRIYREVRIPVHHGLPSRLLGQSADDFLRVLLFDMGVDNKVSLHAFEGFIEHQALRIIKEIVEILHRNQIKEYA